MASILVIEDDAPLRGLYGLVLRDAGHRVREAADGIEGLREVESEVPDLIVTDLVMPNREGIDTILRLRVLPHPPKIIAVSGAPMADIYLTMAARLGADRCLLKPFRNAELVSAVTALLGQPETSPRPFRFIVLDDDGNIAYLNRRQLERAFPGCQVDECTTAVQALDACTRGPVDALIADHHLAGDDGIDVVARLRDQRLDCPIYMVTGSNDPQVASRAYAAGVTRVFTPGDGEFAPQLRIALRS